MQSISFANKLRNTIEVLPYFATLVSEDESNYKFQFVFRVKQTSIVLKALSKVVIKCINPNVVIEKNSNIKVLGTLPLKKKEVLNQAGLYEMHNILCKHKRQVKKAIAKQNSIIAEATINLQNYILPTVSTQILRGIKPTDINELYTIKDSLEIQDLKSNNLLKEFSLLDQGDVKKLNFDLISMHKLHPISAVDTEEKFPTIEKVNLLRNYFLNDCLQTVQKEKAYYVPIKKKVFYDKISIRTFVDIPKNLVNSSLEIHFETYKFERKRLRLIRSEVPIERQVKLLNVEKHLKFFRIPLISPNITVNNEEVEAHQNDPLSNYVKILKKEVTNNGVCSKYSAALEDYVLQESSCSITEPLQDNKFAIFKCISGDSDSTIINPKVSGVVMGKLPYIDTLTMVVTDKIGNSDGVEINVKYPPNFARQFQVCKKVWNGSSFNEKVVVVPFRDFDGESTLVLDQSVVNGEICEYILEYKTETGEVRHSGYTHHHYKKLKNVDFNVSITEPVISVNEGKTSFRFNIETKIDNTQDDKVRSLLDQIGAPKVLVDSLNSLEVSDKFSNLFYHKVVRTNLKTGRKEYFEELDINESFNSIKGTQSLADDILNRSKGAIEDIDPGADYLYEVRTFIRNPLSLTKNFVQKVVVPPTSGKASPRIYYYKPFKWRQPAVLDDGTIPAVDEFNNLLTKKFNEDGEIGVTAKYLLSGIKKSAFTNSLSAERIDLNKVRVSWQFEGSDDEFDHFVIMKEVAGVRRFIGAVTGQEVFDILGNDDVGTVIYYVVPVMYDFSVGNAIKANTIIVDPAELDFKQQISEI
jgi:hypothetical protein